MPICPGYAANLVARSRYYHCHWTLFHVMPPGSCPCHTVAEPSSPRASSLWADFYWVELSTRPSSPDTVALDPCLIYDTCFVRQRNGGRQRNQPTDTAASVRSGNRRLAPKYAHISPIVVFTIHFHSIQHH